MSQSYQFDDQLSVGSLRLSEEDNSSTDQDTSSNDSSRIKRSRSDDSDVNDDDDFSLEGVLRSIEINDYHSASVLIEEMDGEDLYSLINILLAKYIDGDENFISPLDLVKELVRSADIVIDSQDLLDSSLKKAVDDKNEDGITFLLEQGASSEIGIEQAIEIDSDDMLQFFGAPFSNDYLSKAISDISYNAIEYFLREDFYSASEVLIKESKNLSFGYRERLIALVSENAELDQVYDLMKILIENNGEKLISCFIEAFDLEELLTEIEEQDGSNGFYGFILDCAKKYISELEIKVLEMNILSVRFEKLSMSTNILCYPTESFNGDKRLKTLREEISKKIHLDQENRYAANFIGTPFSIFNCYHTLTPYHRSNKNKSETYFRSGKHPFSVCVTPALAQYSPSSKLPESKVEKTQASAPNLGLYNPIESLNSSKKVKPPTKKIEKTIDKGNAQLYDFLLKYKLSICKYIVEGCSQLSNEQNSVIKVGFYNAYPCVMVLIKKPGNAPQKVSVKALNAWVEVIISFLVGLINYKAQEIGLDVEMIRRSSFSFLRPTIAPCDQSIRISVGIIPKDYAEIVISCLTILNETLSIIHNVGIQDNPHLNIALPENCFIATKDYKNYKGTNPVVKNLMELVWLNAEISVNKKKDGGKTTVQNLVRSSFSRDELAIKTYQELSKVVEDDFNYPGIFLDVLRTEISYIFVKKQGKGFSLTFNQDRAIEPILPKYKANVINDGDFFNCIFQILKAISHEQSASRVANTLHDAEESVRVAIQKSTTSNEIKDVYFNLELLMELLYSRTILISSGVLDDPYGSDSDVENDEEDKHKKIYGKKIIVRNGMRAILTSLHASANYLYADDYLNGKNKYPLFLYGAYYETIDAVELIAKFDVKKEALSSNIMIYDINSCGKDGKSLPVLKGEALKNIKTMIVDTTSSTIKLHQDWIAEFRNQKNMKVLFFVSSGFKNEQMGSDKNPYGTIRIFTKDINGKKNITKITEFIKEVENPINSSVSHHYRRMMKRLNCTPRNNQIIDINAPLKFDLKKLSINKISDLLLKIIPVADERPGILFVMCVFAIKNALSDKKLKHHNHRITFRDNFFYISKKMPENELLDGNTVEKYSNTIQIFKHLKSA